MRLPILLLLALPLAACGGGLYFEGDAYSSYFLHPAEETTQERIDRKEIVHWGADPGSKKRIGFLYKYRTQVKGSHTHRECYYIFDRYGATRVGFVTDEGVFYRFNKLGRLGERVGEYTIVTTGLKVFYGIPLRENLDLEEIDPYK